MKKMLLAAAVAAGMSGPALALPDVRIELRARVAAVCNVQSMNLVNDADLSRVAVTTSCNTQHFRIQMASGAQGLPIRHATSPDATLRAAGAGELAVSLNIPGLQTFLIELDSPLEPGQDVHIEIVPV